MDTTSCRHEVETRQRTRIPRYQRRAICIIPTGTRIQIVEGDAARPRHTSSGYCRMRQHNWESVEIRTFRIEALPAGSTSMLSETQCSSSAGRTRPRNSFLICVLLTVIILSESSRDGWVVEVAFIFGAAFVWVSLTYPSVSVRMRNVKPPISYWMMRWCEHEPRTSESHVVYASGNVWP
jgi:hypothetical protein